jgi:molybdate transport system substrate-binding protein
VFVSADEATVERLAATGVAQDRGSVYASGRLVLYVPNGSPLRDDLSDVPRAVADGRLKRFAIANPEHAPYGRAAQQVLNRSGVWDAIRPRLVLGESVSQAMQFAASANAQGGLVPLSLAASPQLRGTGRYVLVPVTMHDPLRQRIVLLKNAGGVARQFRDYVLSAPAREVFVRHGYAVPDDSR